MTNPTEVINFIMNKNVKNSAKNKYVYDYLQDLEYDEIQPRFPI